MGDCVPLVYHSAAVDLKTRIPKCGCPTLPVFGRVGTKSPEIRLPHPPHFWEGGNWHSELNDTSRIVIPSERDPSLRGERESRDLAFLRCYLRESGCPTLPAFGRVGTGT